jgi:dUTPase
MPVKAKATTAGVRILAAVDTTKAAAPKTDTVAAVVQVKLPRVLRLHLAPTSTIHSRTNRLAPINRLPTNPR